MILNEADKLYIGSQEVQKAYLGSELIWSAESQTSGYIRSKNNLTSAGLQVGANPLKDMTSDTRTTLATYLPGNNSFTAEHSYWADWGNDIFDGWGFFYIYDPQQDNYKGIPFSDINNPDGQIATETFSFNDRTFTIKHGHAVTGIYKIDVSVNDDEDFVFGTDGNMGSNSETNNVNLLQGYSIQEQNFILHYNFNSQEDKPEESFYSYVVPYEASKNKTAVPFQKYLYNSDSLAIHSIPVKHGITFYFAKQNNVKDWIINDLNLTETLS